MKRRNFLKWLAAIPAAFVASRLPVEKEPYSALKTSLELEYGGTISKRIDPEWAPNPNDMTYDEYRAIINSGSSPSSKDKWRHVAWLQDKGYIITDSTDNIKEWLKS